MLDKGTCLRFYKRKDIQDAIVAHARGKEVGVRYGDGFGKRPDAILYPREVLELAMRGVTSFHASEERWENPLELESSRNRKELDELRTGWDLVLDIDCPDWEISKITTYLFIKALRNEGVNAISCKFSGNKGFHIGVPFEAFPKQVEDKLTKDHFPEAPKKIAQYLLNRITSKYINIKDNKVIFDEKYGFSLENLRTKFGERPFLINNCSNCKTKVELNREKKTEFICQKCEGIITDEKDDNFRKCEKCNILMEKIENQKTLCECGSDSYASSFDPLSIMEIDTVLISSRHLYRMPYSLHEKSGLASLPIDPDKVMEFEKDMASPDSILTPMFTFMDRNVEVESARRLLVQALDFEVKVEEDRDEKKEFEEIEITSPITEEFFPPCMKVILNGLQDGRKRGIFVMMNFLGKIGWSKNEIEEFLKRWNKENNSEPLREVYLKGQMHSFKPGEKLPPNCSNEAYYSGIGICKPDGLCKKIKNPVNYTVYRWRRYLNDSKIYK